MKCCSLQYVSWTWFLRSVKSKPASLRNSSWISWISSTSDTKRLGNPLFLLHWFLCKLTDTSLQRYFYWGRRDIGERVSRDSGGTDECGESWLSM